jgi:hypothetical protein
MSQYTTDAPEYVIVYAALAAVAWGLLAVGLWVIV